MRIKPRTLWTGVLIVGGVLLVVWWLGGHGAPSVAGSQHTHQHQRRK